MSKPEWGIKHLCPGCSALYYDMKKAPPATCPKCNTVYDPEALLKSRRKMVPEDTKKKTAAPIEEEVEVEVEDVADDAEVVAEELDDDEEIAVEVDADDKDG